MRAIFYFVGAITMALVALTVAFIKKPKMWQAVCLLLGYFMWSISVIW